MDIKRYDYVRINQDCRGCVGIGKVVNTVKETVYIDMNNKYNLPISMPADRIAKYGKHITDVLEVGDFVNGSEVLDIHIPRDTWDPIEITTDSKTINYIMPDDIQTILTREQYEQNCFERK